MKRALIKSGVPESVITMDYAGFRTLDSVVRAKEVFSLTGGFTIISQPFHIERALYLAHANGIDAIGYGAANVSLEYGLYAYLREIPARWLALYDAWFGTEATVLGEKEEIGN
jgi:SanA protein